MSRTERLLLAFTRCNAPASLEDWAAWYDEIHLPALVAAGADVITRFELTQQPVPGMPSIGYSHVAFHEYRGAGADERLDATLRLCDELALAGKLHPNHSLIAVDALSAHGGEKADPSPELTGHIMAYVMSNQPARQAEWDRWYDEVHLPDMMDSGAFASGSRWRRREPARHGANDMTLYDVVGRTVEDAVTQSAGVMPGIVAAGRKLDCHVGAMTVTLRPSGAYGGAGLRSG